MIHRVWLPSGLISPNILTTKLGYMCRAMHLCECESLFPSNCWKYSSQFHIFQGYPFLIFCQCGPKQIPRAFCLPMMQGSHVTRWSAIWGLPDSVRSAILKSPHFTAPLLHSYAKAHSDVTHQGGFGVLVLYMDVCVHLFAVTPAKTGVGISTLGKTEIPPSVTSTPPASIP